MIRLQQRWNDTSLRTRLAVFTTLAFAVVLAAVGLISYDTLQASVEQTLAERQVVAVLIAERVEAQLASSQHALANALLDPRLDLENGDLTPEESWLREIHTASPLFKRVLLLDVSGNTPIMSPASAELAGRNMTEPPYSIRLPLGTSPIIEPAVGYQSGTPALRFIQPVHSPRGGTVGYLLGWLDVSDPSAAPLLFPFSPSEGGVTDLVDQTGRVLISSETSRVGLMTDHAGHFARLIGSRAISAGTCHSCHDPGLSRENDLLAFAPLEAAPWGIALRQPESQVFAGTQAYLRNVAALVLTILIVFSLLVLASTNSLAKPLEALSAASRRIAHGDLTQPIRVGGTAETKALAASFETMRQDLLAYRTETESARRDLEHRVDERTAELRQTRDHLLATNRNLIALNAVAAILSQSLDLRETLDLALRRAMETIGADRGLLFLQPPGGAAALAAHHGLSEAELEALRGLPAPGGPREDGGWPVDGAPTSPQGESLAKALGRPSVVCVPLEAKGDRLGWLCAALGPGQELAEADHALLSSIGAQIALAVRNARLYDALQVEQKSRTRLLHKLIAAQEEERGRVARELHDETSQAITALMLGLDTVGLALAHNPEDAGARLAAARSVADGMLQDIHRLISDLRPSLLDDLGLMPAISWYAEQRLNPQGIAFHLECDGLDGRLPAAIETAVYRIVQEAVTNVLRHAGASSVWLRLAQARGHLSVQVRDNGKGINHDGLQAEAPGNGVGLRGMRERVHLLGGDFRVDSTPGDGTTIRVTLPVHGLASDTRGIPA